MYIYIYVCGCVLHIRIYCIFIFIYIYFQFCVCLCVCVFDRGLVGGQTLGPRRFWHRSWWISTLTNCWPWSNWFEDTENSHRIADQVYNKPSGKSSRFIMLGYVGVFFSQVFTCFHLHFGHDLLTGSQVVPENFTSLEEPPGGVQQGSGCWFKGFEWKNIGKHGFTTSKHWKFDITTVRHHLDSP